MNSEADETNRKADTQIPVGYVREVLPPYVRKKIFVSSNQRLCLYMTRTGVARIFLNGGGKQTANHMQ